ncbi:MAG: HD domain-containing protein [Nitrospirae bacterium]|nr:HD domain-containing protein [Nitrospirota bacterium]
MTHDDLIYFKNWFSIYTKSFYSSNEEDQRNIMLKVTHTHNVCKNIIEITKDLSICDNEKLLAETVALFHDIGRFPQYAKYKTFKDAASVSHGRLGAKTLIGERVLQRIPADEQALIINAVRFHGVLLIPSVMDEKTIFMLKLIRDADKLDILRVFIEFYEAPEDEKASATAHGMPDTPEYSKDMLQSILERKIASYSKARNQNDFRLMKLSWVYDLHFQATFRLLQERDCINRIARKMPQTDEILMAIKKLQQYISERVQVVHAK